MMGPGSDCVNPFAFRKEGRGRHVRHCADHVRLAKPQRRRSDGLLARDGGKETLHPGEQVLIRSAVAPQS
jgi:hypothetical protein